MKDLGYLLSFRNHWFLSGVRIQIYIITAFEEFNKQFRELFPDLKEKICFLRKPIELHYLTRVVKSELGYS
jgi:hypothetical protein